MKITHADDGRIVYTFRQSWIGSFLRCPELARREAFDPDFVSGGSDATAIGTAMHAGAEHNLRESATFDECLDKAVAEFDYETTLPGFRYVQVAKRETAITQVQNTLDVWYHQIRPKVGIPISIEDKFSVELYSDEHMVIMLNGTMDCVDDHGMMWDWKTANDKEKYGQRKAWEYQRWAVQPTVYTYAWYVLSGEIVPFTFAVALKGKPNQDAQFLAVDREQHHWDWLAEQLRSVINMYATMGEAGPWPLNDQHVLCSPRWCANWADCKGAIIDSM